MNQRQDLASAVGAGRSPCPAAPAPRARLTPSPAAPDHGPRGPALSQRLGGARGRRRTAAVAPELRDRPAGDDRGQHTEHAAGPGRERWPGQRRGQPGHQAEGRDRQAPARGGGADDQARLKRGRLQRHGGGQVGRRHQPLQRRPPGRPVHAWNADDSAVQANIGHSRGWPSIALTASPAQLTASSAWVTSITVRRSQASTTGPPSSDPAGGHRLPHPGAGPHG
jgi:hypothetical protein